MARIAWHVRAARADGGRRRRYQRWAGVLAAVVATGLPLLAATTAQASGAGDFVSLTNSARADHGASRLAVSSDLASVAQRQAQRMADKGELFHNPKLASDVHNWQKIGENVGYGPDASSIQNAFMHSAGHRANILDKAFTQIGVGVVVKQGVVWVSVVFRQPEGAVAAKPHHAKPKPKPKPSPTPSPTHHTPASTPAKHVTPKAPTSSSAPPSHHPSPTPSASKHSTAPPVKHSAAPSPSSPAPTVAAVPVVTSSSGPSTPLTVGPAPAAAGPLDRSTPADSSSGPSPWAALGTLGILAVLGLALSLRVRSR